MKQWIENRRHFGLYDQLMIELRKEDQRSFKNVLRMEPDMFDELLERVISVVTKQFTCCRAALEPGLTLARTLRYLASGRSYSSMKSLQGTN